MGTAPLDDPQFRSAMFEQLGGARLEVAVTTDICGKKDSHAVRLDKEAVETIKKARLHQKVATTIFFESNGGQSKAEATLPEVRLAVAEPDIDMGNIETVLETLLAGCSAEASRPASGRTGRHRHGASVKTPQELMHHASPDVRSAYTQRL
jgi:integrase